MHNDELLKRVEASDLFRTCPLVLELDNPNSTHPFRLRWLGIAGGLWQEIEKFERLAREWSGVGRNTEEDLKRLLCSVLERFLLGDRNLPAEIGNSYRKSSPPPGVNDNTIRNVGCPYLAYQIVTADSNFSVIRGSVLLESGK